MKFDELENKLLKGEEVFLFSKEYLVKRQLKEIVGNIPKYVIRVVDGIHNEVNDFESFEELRGSYTLPECKICGELIDVAYYYDKENSEYYCSIDCLTSEFNNRFGFGNWTTMLDGAFKPFTVHVKIDEEQAEYIKDCIKKDGQYWRKYDLEFCSDNIFSKLFEDDNVFGDEDIDIIG